MYLTSSTIAGYASGADPAAKSITWTASGAPSDGYSTYKITSYSVVLNYVETYVTSTDFSVTVDGYGSFTISGNTYNNNASASTSGSSLSNTFLGISSGTGSIDAHRNSGSGTGNLCLYSKGSTSSVITITLTYEKAYSVCGAPTSISVGNTTPDAGSNITLSWNGASVGEQNPITGYQVYRATSPTGSYAQISAVTTSQTSGSIIVASPSAMGSSFYFKVLTVGTVTGYNSALSSTYAGITSQTYSSTGAATVAISNTTMDSGQSVTLTWSGALSGTNNAIVGYDIYFSVDGISFNPYATVSSTETSGSKTILLTADNDTTYSFKLTTVGSAGYNSGYSNTVAVKVLTYTPCSAPANLQLSSGLVEISAILTWNASSNGRNNPLSKYIVKYQESNDNMNWGALTLAGEAVTNQLTVYPSTNAGSYRRFLVIAVGEKASFDSAPSNYSSSLKKNTPPSTPILLAPMTNTVTYSKTPSMMVNVGVEPDGQIQTIYAKVDSGAYASAKAVAASGGNIYFNLPEMSVGSHTVSIKVLDSAGGESPAISKEIEVAAATWTDGTLANQPVKAIHIQEIRNYVNTQLTYAGIGSRAWTDTLTAGMTQVKAIHFTELQSALKLAGSIQTFSPVIRNGRIRKEGVIELRNAIEHM